jgi:putative peptidoglycan lipid II flippase
MPAQQKVGWKAGAVSVYSGSAAADDRLKTPDDQDQMTGPKSHSLFRSTVVVGLASVLPKAMVLAKDVAIAAALGRGDALEAYLLALAIPTTLGLAATAAMAPVLTPVFMRLQQDVGKGIAEIRQVLKQATLGLMLFSIVAFLLMWLFRDGIVDLAAPGFAPDKKAMMASILPVLAASLLFSNLAGLWAGVLIAERKLVLAVVTPAAVPFAILLALFSGNMSADADVLAWATFWGAFIQAALAGWAVQRRGWLVLPGWPSGQWLREGQSLFQQYIILVVGSLTMAATDLVDLSMAASLNAGDPAAVSFGAKITMIVTVFGAGMLGTSTLPHFADLAQRDRQAFVQSVRKVAITVALIGALGTVFIALFGEMLVSLVFERGRFGRDDVTAVAAVNFMFAFQVPFYLAGIVLARAISAIGENRYLTIGAVINLAVNIVMNYVLMQSMGAAGIALSTSLMYVVSCLFLLVMLWRRLRKPGDI